MSNNKATANRRPKNLNSQFKLFLKVYRYLDYFDVIYMNRLIKVLHTSDQALRRMTNAMRMRGMITSRSRGANLGHLKTHILPEAWRVTDAKKVLAVMYVYSQNQYDYVKGNRQYKDMYTVTDEQLLLAYQQVDKHCFGHHDDAMISDVAPPMPLDCDAGKKLAPWEKS